MQEIPDGNSKAFTFWDNGSMLYMVSRQYAKKRKLKGVKVRYDLSTVNHVTTPQRTMVYDVPIIDPNGVTICIKAYKIDAICDDIAFVDSRVTKLFNNLKIEDVTRPRTYVDLLIGLTVLTFTPQKYNATAI